MLKILCPLLALAALAACQSSPSATETAADQPAPPTVAAPAAAQCYGYAAQDTAYLTFTSSGAAVTGTLIYHYAGKDRNRGRIQGSLSGDTLRADYTFLSEGVESVREVAFVKQAGGLVEGYGPVVERGGKTVFEHPHQLKFDTRISLAPVACK